MPGAAAKASAVSGGRDDPAPPGGSGPTWAATRRSRTTLRTARPRQIGYHLRVPQPPRPNPRAPAAPSVRKGAPSRALPVAILLLALVGVAIAADLWAVHRQVHAGAGSVFCDFNEQMSCSDVARSPWSVLLGVPLAAWGMLAYLTVAALAASALLRRKAGSTWPAGFLASISGLMTLAAVGLALVSELVIHTLCVMCAASWAISVVLLVLSILLARRAGGLGAAVRADLRAVRARPFPVAAGLVLLVGAGAALVVTSAAAPAPPPPTRRPTLPVPASIPIGPPGSLLVYEYSDYLCPYCARVHGEEKASLARRPDLKIVRRHFPLDATCNPRLKRSVHEGACDLARGGICAEKQGRFEAYDDAAFAAQESRPGVEALASQSGLDLAAFKACLASPDTERQLAADIQSAIAAGISGTPTYQYQGRLIGTRLPPELGGPPIVLGE